MAVIFFSRKRVKTGKRIKNLVKTALPAKCVKVCHTIESVSARLRHPGNPSIMILLAGNREDLYQLFALRDLMNDIDIILLLPDNGKDTVAMGLKLYPRFVGYLNEDLLELPLVLKKMTTKTVKPCAPNIQRRESHE